MQELWIALALVLVLEGLMPAISPLRWRQMVQSILTLSDRKIRIGALACMVIGALMLSVVR